MVLIGGQAVLFWQRQLGTGDDPDGIVETSGDIDFAVADREVVEHCAELLGGRAQFADPFDVSPNFALILFTDEHGHRRQLDVIAAPLGLRLDDVRLTAQPIAAPGGEDDEDLVLYVLHPERMLEGRVATVAVLRADAIALAQLRSAIRSCRAHLAWILDNGPEDERVRIVLRQHKRLFQLARSLNGREVWAEHGIDVLDAVLTDHPALPAAFLQQDLPRQRAQIASMRSKISSSG